MAFDVAEGEGVVAGALLVNIRRERGKAGKRCSGTRRTN
jgi:hypothetical protein